MRRSEKYQNRYECPCGTEKKPSPISRKYRSSHVDRYFCPYEGRYRKMTDLIKKVVKVK